MKTIGRPVRLARLGLWASAAGITVLGAAAHAQRSPDAASPTPRVASGDTFTKPATPPIIPPPPGAPTDDGLAGGGFYLEADELIEDDRTQQVTAKGSVEARYNDRTVRAEEIDYARNTGVVTARGKVQILNPDGTAQFADAITLDKDMSEGVALGFSARLSGNVKIAAASAIRHDVDITEMNRVIYTPCDVCSDGKSEPTWSIKARKIIQDKKRQRIYYQDAVIQVKGVGIMFFPAFWTADPSSDRKSGFLAPQGTFSGKRGATYEQSYYQVISKSQDITLTPQINTKVNPFLNVDWRRRFYSGTVDVRAGFTYDRDFDSGGNKFGDLTTRSYILGHGAFQITDAWRWGFTAERTSDDLIFDKYDIGDVFKENGLYAADDRRLISQIYAVRQDQQSFLSIAALSIQGLRPTDDDSTFPTVAPLIEAHWEPTSAILGGRLRIDGSAVILTRDRSPTDASLPGTDSRRATIQGDWQRDFTLSNGLRIAPFLQARADVYSLSQLQAPYNPNATITRGFGTAGVNISYPLIKQAGDRTYILEPMAQVALSPNVHLDPRIPNEDSVVWEFDETNLFQIDKSPGFDLYEGGQRINVGGRATVLYGDGRTASFMAGQSFRTEDDPSIPARTGLSTKSSDYILAAEATPIQGVSLFSRWRLDSRSGAINRLEAGGDFSTRRVEGYVRYLQENEDPTGSKVKDLDFRGAIYATKHWGVTVYGVRDIEGGAWRRRDVGVVYRDECVRLEVVYRRDETVNRTLGPSNAVVLRLTLATLGNSGYRP